MIIVIGGTGTIGKSILENFKESIIIFTTRYCNKTETKTDKETEKKIKTETEEKTDLILNK